MQYTVHADGQNRITLYKTKESSPRPAPACYCWLAETLILVSISILWSVLEGHILSWTMSVVITLSSDGSGPHQFTERIFSLSSGESISVGRADTGHRSDLENGYFNSKVRISQHYLIDRLIDWYPGQVLSKKHAKIIHKGGTVFLQDLGSTNGTYINKTRLSRPGGDCIFVSHWISIIRETKQTERDLLRRPGPVRNWGHWDTTSPGQCDHHWPGWGSPQ